VRWLSPEEVEALPMHPSMRLRIEHALDESRTHPLIG
jgi:hypothetical protein